MKFCNEHMLPMTDGDLSYVKTGGRYYDVYIILLMKNNLQHVTSFTLCKQHSAEKLLTFLDATSEEINERLSRAFALYKKDSTPASRFAVSRRVPVNPQLRKFKRPR